MKLKNILLAGLTLSTLACADYTTQPSPILLSLKDYSCADDACNTRGNELPISNTRPLRFLSIAQYPGKQDYYWELTWTDTVLNQTGAKVAVAQKLQYYLGSKDESSALNLDLTKSPKVDYRLLVRVRNDSIVEHWRPLP